MYLRNTLGQKTPRHSHVSRDVVKTKRVSIQGFWHNSADPRLPPLPEEVEDRKQLSRQVGFHKLKEEVGLHGITEIVQTLLAKQEKRKQLALAAIPKPQRILPTE